MVAPALSPQKVEGLRPLSAKESAQRAQALACNVNAPAPSCMTQLNIGVFFDGTNNNRARDEPDNSHSNVVRLFNAHKGGLSAQRAAGYYRIYIPGVGTKFNDVGDDANDNSAGNGVSAGAAARIHAALVRVYSTIQGHHAWGAATSFQKGAEPAPTMPIQQHYAAMVAATNHTDSLQKLRAYMQPYLATLSSQLLPKHKPSLTQININAFGFSRGAAEARGFANFFLSLCQDSSGQFVEPEKLDHQADHTGYTFAGVPIRFGFLGLFDTVASVGLADAIVGFDGHMSWAQKHLKIPAAVERCVHFVAAHEARASFPLDSVRDGNRLPANCVEVVYPGMHSDVGGGYSPGQQGHGVGVGKPLQRGELGEKRNPKLDYPAPEYAPAASTQLAQIPLRAMHREALASGVPLFNLTEMMEDARFMDKSSASYSDRDDNLANYRNNPQAGNPLSPQSNLYYTDYHLDEGLRIAFNDYMQAANVPNSLPLEKLMHHHRRQLLRWMLLRLPNIDRIPCVKAAKTTDPQGYLDLQDTYREFSADVKRTQKLIDAHWYVRAQGGIEAELEMVKSAGIGAAIMGRSLLEQVNTLMDVRNERPLIDNPQSNGYETDRKIIQLFDVYMHDSRAGFKPVLDDKTKVKSDADYYGFSRREIIYSHLRYRTVFCGEEFAMGDAVFTSSLETVPQYVVDAARASYAAAQAAANATADAANRAGKAAANAAIVTAQATTAAAKVTAKAAQEAAEATAKAAQEAADAAAKKAAEAKKALGDLMNQAAETAQAAAKKGASKAKEVSAELESAAKNLAAETERQVKAAAKKAAVYQQEAFKRTEEAQRYIMYLIEWQLNTTKQGVENGVKSVRETSSKILGEAESSVTGATNKMSTTSANGK